MFTDHNETNEEIELKILNETKNAQLTHSRVKRSVQNYHRLTPHEQQLQRHHQRQLQHQYENHQRELRERELRERQRNTQLSQQRTNTNTSPPRDARRYQQMQQPPPQQQFDNQMYHYRHDYQNPQQSSQHQKSDETKEYTIEVLVAVDKKMQEYHGKDLKNYVLTLMSVVSRATIAFDLIEEAAIILLSLLFLSSFLFVRRQVSSIYADASIGNSIKIAVVHIMYVEHDLVPDASSGNGKFDKEFYYVILLLLFWREDTHSLRQ